jgi:effector-binding domain-containing protein
VGNRLGVAPSGPPGALYGAEIADDVDEEVEAFVPLAEEVTPSDLPGDRGDVTVGRVPAARVAVATHNGPYDTISESYRRLGAWVAENAATAHERVREIYVVSFGQTDDPQRFRTEIHWPVLA